MKMTPLLWRVVSLSLCFSLALWYPSYYVGCTEEARRSVSSRDIILEEESKEEIHEVEETFTPALLLVSESEHWLEATSQNEEKATEEEEKTGQYLEVLEVDEPAEDMDWPSSQHLLEPEPASLFTLTDNPPPQDDQSLTASPEVAFTPAAEVKEAVDAHSQDGASDSLPHDSSAADPLEVDESVLPPADCDEEEANPYDGESSPPIVLENTSNAHTTGTKTHSDPPLSPSAVQHLETNVSHPSKELDRALPASTDGDPSGKDPEDIPTFDEWKRKMMEVEQEKTQTTHTSNNGASTTVKKVQKNFNNYASVECGAKILGANPEAKSTSAILKENMDLYMLNPCSNKIWFIIELCEPIQLKQLDIANFELFSSTPKDFLVSISDRYPTNKWVKLGTFHGRDERTVQSFPLDEHLYAKYMKMFTKYIKVELVSHFGSEHFCPLSLIRVFGTSMVEEYEEIADPSERPDDQDDELDYPPGHTAGEVKCSNNLIGSAKDVILNMVNNIAVNVLGGGPGNMSTSEGINSTDTGAPFQNATDSSTTDLNSVSDADEVEIPSETSEAEAEPAPQEPPVTEPHQQEATPEREQIVIPLEKEEEDDISSTVTLLDKDEDEEKSDGDQERQHSRDYCALFPAFFSSYSLQEYLLQRCSALLYKQRKNHISGKKRIIPSIQTATWQPPASPSACPVPTLLPTEEPQKQDEDQMPQQDSVAGDGINAEATTELPLLEPSQTSTLPPLASAGSSPANASAAVETPELSTELLTPEKTPDVLAQGQLSDASPSSSSSILLPPSASDVSTVAPAEEEPSTNVTNLGKDSSTSTPVTADQSQIQPTASHLDQQGGDASTEPSQAAADSIAELEPSTGHSDITQSKQEDLTEDIANGQLPPPVTSGPPASSILTDIYAEPLNGSEQNGNPVHGSSQKESVFMRLNNRIKALEMNMSLSGRYLEQLSQRYRRQMEEMQKAFNKTIIKLQNTSRIAEEQDQRQTESIQILQGQLENMTQLVLNLSARVGQLQSEVSDRETYLLLSLLLCLCLGLVLLLNRSRPTAVPTPEPEAVLPGTYNLCSPERSFSCEDGGLKRSASYPLIHTEELQLDATEDILHAEETTSLCAAIRKKRRRKMKPLDQVDSLSFQAASELCNGAPKCNGGAVVTRPTLAQRFLQPAFRDSPSEPSSETSSHSDDPSFCGFRTACPRICDGLPPPKTRAEKRALRRRRHKPTCVVVDYHQIPQRDKSHSLPLPNMQDPLCRKSEQSSRTFGVTFSGPVYTSAAPH
ncbi:SUN domain-containing ossification factor-like isoform X1 [Synchiropus splendidus]|uniref:SUN domain-containing ossification factor-like isoform X1 n=1 Tax=Synchiropus splendidus TaxID=270530 RepID=UPI00237E590F|nr:SUN domain-containing ossification factor-like isoform X1 [Synchiropus splendidus]